METTQVSMEDRLKMTISQSHTDKESSNKADEEKTRKDGQKGPVAGESMAILLVQGLHSGDKHILDQVFDKNDDAVIISTVKHMPVQSIPQLLKELSQRFKTKTDLRPYIKWLRYALVNNLSYISSNPDVLEQVCSYYHEFESRVSLMDNMLKLQGKINFLMDQYDCVHKQGQFSAENAALATYEDDSSSDTESEAENQESSESESEKNWDDLDWKEGSDQEENEKDDSEDEEFLSLSKSSKFEKKTDEFSENEEMDENSEDEAESDEKSKEDDGSNDFSMEMG